MDANLAVIVATLLIYPGAWTFQWTSGSLQPGATITVCSGQHSADLVWSYQLDYNQQDNDIVWVYRLDEYSGERLLASVYRGHFIPESNVHQHLTFLPPYGLRLTDLTSQDRGNYTIKVNINQYGTLYSFHSSVYLNINDQVVVTHNALRVSKLSDIVYDNQTHEWRALLSCGTFTSLGNPPVEIFFKTPDNQVLTNTTYENGHFTVTLPNPVVTGDYTCQIANTQDTCLPSNSPLLAPATVHVFACNLQLDVNTAELSTLEDELQKLQSELSSLERQLFTERQDHQQCSQQLAQRTTDYDRYQTTVTPHTTSCQYGRWCDYSPYYSTVDPYRSDTTHEVYDTSQSPIWNWPSHVHQLEVRLVGGSSCNEGRLEVRVHGCSQWGTVCDDEWGYADAEVVCRQLGFRGVSNELVDWYRGGPGSILLDDVGCRGDEASIAQCSFPYGFAVHNCGHNEDVGLVCLV